MILLAALLLQLQAPPAPAPAPVIAPPPADWTQLPDLPLARHWPSGASLSPFVQAEVAAGRCAAAQRGSDGYVLRVDLAVLIDNAGTVRRIVPRAIGCPTVEQYSAGIVSRVTRDNVPTPQSDTWYRTALTFSWRD
ncbi:hypothetical protein [Sphingomonas sp.]|uniref:hypothetical protein n=1 Tax=Sphingomonas sp. TaxID=28214 RepID=UPI0025809C9D|nr:hypothetical protein [Sphingomonas sp.]